MNNFAITMFLTYLSPELPFFAIYLIGLVLAVVRRKRHPSVSILAGTYFSFKMIFSVLDMWYIVYTTYYITQGHNFSEYVEMRATLSALDFLFGIFLFVVLLYAVFGWRDGQKTEISKEQIVQ